MKVKILKLSCKLFDGDVDSLTLPSEQGQITILPRHISILTKLTKGKIVIRHDNESKEFNIIAGICSFSNNTASVILY
ncbi:MAG: F0F1 ATP synthase subunit epsilon [Alphaproteobacteria bacterium]|nr:F0F1 ATP synthase subunit epsilon [Alphaproteobacteria bacterium]